MLKFEESLLDHPFILSFDLAKHIVGWSLVKIGAPNYEIVECGLINLSKYHYEDFWLVYQRAIREAFNRAIMCARTLSVDPLSFKSPKIPEIVVIKEKLPSQAGGSSTIATLQALAKAHAVFDLTLYEAIEDCKPLVPYDGCAPCGVEGKESEGGIHAASVKALFRKITGLEKPTKQDIRAAVVKMCVGEDISELREDISDSVAVAITLCEVKYNADIEEEKKALRRKIRSLKLDSAKEPYQKEIERLDSLKLPKSSYGKV